MITVSLFGRNAQAAVQDHLSSSEISYSIAAMEGRQIGSDKPLIELMYDGDDQPSYILASGEKGFLIINRNTLEVMECTEEISSPYSDDTQTKKYYGGIFQYYVKDNGIFNNIANDQTSKTLPGCEILMNQITSSNQTDSLGQTKDKAINTQPTASVSSVVTTKMLYNNRGAIRIKAFGNNQVGSPSEGTCSAVATCLGLTYLDSLNSNVLLSGYTPEKLVSADFKAGLYPQAIKLHNLMSQTYGMGPLSWADGIVDPLNRYKNSSSTIKNTGLSLNWFLFASSAYVREQIDKGYPAMMTTFLADGYNFHTMLIYGYRKLSDGDYEYCVHPGWYGAPYILSSSTTEPVVALKWVPASFAKYSYKLSINN